MASDCCLKKESSCDSREGDATMATKRKVSENSPNLDDWTSSWPAGIFFKNKPPKNITEDEMMRFHFYQCDEDPREPYFKKPFQIDQEAPSPFQIDQEAPSHKYCILVDGDGNEIWLEKDEKALENQNVYQGEAPRSRRLPRELGIIGEVALKYERLDFAIMALEQYNKEHSTKYKLVEAINSRVFVHNNICCHCVFSATNDSCVLEQFFAELIAVEPGEYEATTTRILADTETTYDGCVFCLKMGIPHPINRFQRGFQSDD